MKVLGWNHKQRQLIMLGGLVIAIVILMVTEQRSYKHDYTVGPVDIENYEVSKEPGFICIGYREESKTWGEWNTSEICPKGYGIPASSDSSGKNRFGPPQYVNLNARCCRLPYDDILTNSHVYNILESCPENSIATSGTGACRSNCSMRCTYINTDKYKLGPETQALYAKDLERTAYSGRGSAALVSLYDVPLGLRWTVTRESFDKFSPDGCVGSPFGSMFVRKSAKQCSGYYYRQLLFKDGTPVPVVPHCDAISDIYDPNAKCLVRKKLPEGTVN